MKSAFLRLLRNESGATAVEYALMAALVGVVALTALTKLGTNLSAKFNTIANNVT
jgi:pilus assembly protein Flp/PilA